MRPWKASQHRLDRLRGGTLRSHEPMDELPPDLMPKPDSVLDCGWGRLIFGHTFETPEKVADALRSERPGRRDVGFYIRDPHIVISLAPQDLFLDPSHTYRLWMSDYRPGRRMPTGFVITPVRTRADAAAVNRIYAQHGMMTVDEDFLWASRHSRKLCYLVAKHEATGEVLGVVMGADHRHAFGDPDNGASLWSLAVDPQAPLPGIGEALVRRLAERYKARGRAFMDLSVMHDNAEAVALYEKLGFKRVPVFTLKNRNSINERLYVGPPIEEGFNPYARIIIDEALRRGIAVEPIDPAEGYFRLVFGGRSIVCREALSELTTAVAMSRCDDKTVTCRLLAQAGLEVPAQQFAGSAEDNAAFLARHGSLVVKPVRGEQGVGVSVDLRTPEDVEQAIGIARRSADQVILQRYVKGEDLRIIVIGQEVVAAAIRKPAEIVGTGRHTVAQLIDRQSRRRAAATGGESRIPMDEETERCVRAAGYSMEDTPPEGETIRVRKAANLHTGGTIHDVTDMLHPVLADAAIRAAAALDIPVVGLDFLVASVEDAGYVIIEANERPGLANHEPQPTARKFIDLLFPRTVARASDASAGSRAA